jgi:hypothetical protein
MFDADGNRNADGRACFILRRHIVTSFMRIVRALVLDTYFYILRLENGEAVSVTQVYTWP